MAKAAFDLPDPEPLELLEFGEVLKNEDGSRWLRAALRVAWVDPASDTAFVVEAKLPLSVDDKRTLTEMRREAFARLPSVLREAAERASKAEGK